MKNILFISLSLFITNLIAQEDGNYLAVINGDSLMISLDKPFSYVTKSGETLNFKIFQPDILTYSDAYITFKHHKTDNVSNSVLDVGIEQLMVMKSTGSGFIIQKYSSIDPALLTGLLLNEVTKESINYGYKKEEEDFTVSLKSGNNIKGKKVTLTYKGEVEIYTAAAYSGKDEGIIILTMDLKESAQQPDEPMINLFWDTLEIKKN